MFAITQTHCLLIFYPNLKTPHLYFTDYTLTWEPLHCIQISVFSNMFAMRKMKETRIFRLPEKKCGNHQASKGEKTERVLLFISHKRIRRTCNELNESLEIQDSNPREAFTSPSSLFLSLDYFISTARNVALLRVSLTLL